MSAGDTNAIILIQRIHRAIRFIEDHLSEPIALADVAESVNFSLYHFCRTFNCVVRHSPYDYLIRRRLSEAARRLIESDSKIIDIAFDYQFNSAESFSRAFKKMFGIQPIQYRRQGFVDRRCILGALSIRHLELLNKAVSLIPVQADLSEITITGLMSPVDRETAVIQQLWSDLDRETDSGRSSVGAPSYFGVVSFPGGWSQNRFYYLAGIRQENAAEPNPALTRKELPSVTCACFEFIAKVGDLPLILEYIYQTWLPKKGHEQVIPYIVLFYGSKPERNHVTEIAQQVYVPLV